MQFNVRPLGNADAELVELATLGAVNWSHDAFTRDQIRGIPAVCRYFDQWPRQGDFGFAAVDEAGIAIGVTWLRTFSADEPGYGFVAPDIPELGLWVAPGFRGQGIGGSLLSAAIAEARHRALFAISLSVEEGNPARRLYERHGFAPAGGGVSVDVLVRYIEQQKSE